MPIPDYQSAMLPLLEFAADGKEHSLREAIESLSGRFQLSEDERSELLPSGRQSIIANRVGWARTYMSKAGLFESARRGYFRISARGRQVLSEKPSAIDTRFLRRFPEFIEFQTFKRNEDAEPEATIEGVEQQTPEEAIETAYQKLRASLVAHLLDRIMTCSPEFFERLVVDLLVRMGYGGTRSDAGRAVGKSGDGGIDGIIKEDRLGLDTIYIQAKRWDGTVGRPEVQKFAGALQGHRAKKGVFLTTSRFSDDAAEFVQRLDSKIVLLDGKTLAGLMLDHGLGCSLIATYEVKRIDSDYFTDET